MDHRGWKTKTIDITWPKSEGTTGLSDALDRICNEAEHAIASGFQLVVLSDRNIGSSRIALPTLLATGAVHHHLVRQFKRTRIGIVVPDLAACRDQLAHILAKTLDTDSFQPGVSNKQRSWNISHWNKGICLSIF